MAKFKNRRTGNVMNVTNEITIDIMRDSDQYDELDENGNPIKGIPRHPILEDNVIVYSNATVLGRITLAEGTVIGGNLWVTESTKPGEHLVQARKRISE